MAQDSDFSGPEEEVFLAAMDGELAAEDKARFEERLDSEPGFRERFERYRQTVDLLRRLGPRPAPESLLPSVQRRITRRAAMAPVPLLRFPYELLGFILILGCYLYLYFGVVPPAPGPIDWKETATYVEMDVDLVAPLPKDTAARFSMVEVSTQGGKCKYLGRMSRDTALAFLTEVAPLTREGKAPPLPEGERIRVTLQSPLP